MKFALLFPGQGAQHVGMGQSYLTESRESAQLFDDADDILGFSLRQFMFDGPIADLTATAIAQPAILLHSIVVLRALTKKYSQLQFNCALGHSLGEYSALVAAGVLSFSDALKAVHTRGTLMQKAVPVGVGSMAAVLGMEPQQIVDALDEFADDKSDLYAVCANFNGPLQTVIAGTKAGVDAASQKLKALGAKRVIELPVSAPFHCALMRSAQEKMADVLSTINFNDAQFPVISNVSAQAETKGSRIRELLLLQIASPVKFTQCVDTVVKNDLLGDGFLELGPKNTLSGIVKKIHQDGATFNVDTVVDLENFSRGLHE